MPIRERIKGGLTKHAAIEMFALIIAIVVIATIVLYLLVVNFGLEISFTMGDLLLSYVPAILLSVVGAGAMSYGRESGRKLAFGIGIGMLLVGVAYLVIQTFEIIYYGVVV